MNRLFLAAVVVSCLVGFSAEAQKGKKELITFAVEDVKFFPMDPKQPDGLAIAVVEGDPMKGAATYFLRIPKGASGIHAHTADYRATVVKGTHKHWAEGKDADAKALGVGSAWFQPGKAMHGDECVSAEPCVLFIVGAGKFDYKPGKNPAPMAMPTDKPADKAEKAAEKTADKAEKAAEKPAEKK